MFPPKEIQILPGDEICIQNVIIIIHEHQ